MKVAVGADAEAVGRAGANTAARLLRDAIEERGRAVFVAATGLSQIGFLGHLATTRGLAWERTTMFHLDEYVGLPPDHPASLRRYLRERLTSRVPIGTVHWIAGDAADLGAELARLARLVSATPIDLAILGLGENAHVAFNDPPADFDTEAPYIVVRLGETSREQQWRAGWFPAPAEVPRQAVSMSIRQIMKARTIVCLAPERRKAAAVRAMLEADVDPAVPASILRRHPRGWLFLDRESASELRPETLAAFT